MCVRACVVCVLIRMQKPALYRRNHPLWSCCSFLTREALACISPVPALLAWLFGTLPLATAAAAWLLLGLLLHQAGLNQTSCSVI